MARHAAAFGDVSEGVEIAHGHIGHDADGLQMRETSVDRDDEVEEPAVHLELEVIRVEIGGADKRAMSMRPSSKTCRSSISS